MSVCICKYVDFKNYSHLYLIQKIYNNNKTQITHTHTLSVMLNKIIKKTLSLSLTLSFLLYLSWLYGKCVIF